MPIDPAQLRNSALFKLFWEAPTDDDQHRGLAHRGLDEVSHEGVQKLIDYAQTHEEDGTVSPQGQRKISDQERGVIRAILEHPHYGAFFEQGTREPLMRAFGIDPGTVRPPPDAKRPHDAGTLQLPARVSRTSASQLAGMDPEKLPEAFTQEYARNQRHFEDPRASEEEKGARVLGLLRDYTAALWSRGEIPRTEQIGLKLLGAFHKTPFARVLGAQSFNGAAWSAAQSLVLGLDPNHFQTAFPEAYPDVPTTYLSMNGQMAGAMAHVDAYRAALRLPPKAAAYERLPVLNWLIGEESGHTKHGNLDEKKPFSSSGVNWGRVLFAGDREVAGLPPKDGFEFPIDCVGRLDNHVKCLPHEGDRLVVRDQSGKQVRVDKVIHRDERGTPVSWSCRFFNGAGRELKPDEVLGVILNSAGQVKGDGTAEQSVVMWWWGFCDHNAAQRLYKSKYRIPQLDAGGGRPIRIKAGNDIIEVPRAEAQRLLDSHIPDLVGPESYCGFRFSKDPQQIGMADGTWITGQVQEDVLEGDAAIVRYEGDTVIAFDHPQRRLLGNLQMKVAAGNGYTMTIDVKNIETLTRDPTTGTVTIKVKQGQGTEYTGELLTEVPWNKGKLIGGKLVLEQTDQFPVRGAITVNTHEGEKRLDLTAVASIVGETKKELRISQYMAWLSENKGIVATDASTGEVVSNGVRWVHRLDMDERPGSERPSWAPSGALRGIQGPLDLRTGDKICWVRGLFANDNDSEPNSVSFSGWIHLDQAGNILNEGFLTGQPDFGWTDNGKLDWTRPSSFNPHMPPEMLVKLIVNGVPLDQLDDIAKRLNLPPGYRRHLVLQNPV